RPTVPSVVLEFHANLKFSHDDKVYIRGREVEVSSSIISEYYKVLCYINDVIEVLELKNFNGINLDSIMSYLIKGQGMWEREMYTN
ncbi:hypothetical protein Golax_010700, partial [Gossypium laxum]|nr:hypothetical protein [Gossypium laxum]